MVLAWPEYRQHQLRRLRVHMAGAPAQERTPGYRIKKYRRCIDPERPDQQAAEQHSTPHATGGTRSGHGAPVIPVLTAAFYLAFALEKYESRPFKERKGTLNLKRLSLVFSTEYLN
jgi:hypothetical protein